MQYPGICEKLRKMRGESCQLRTASTDNEPQLARQTWKVHGEAARDLYVLGVSVA